MQISSKLKGGYRFGYNGQEKVDEIAGAGNHTTAEFWEYDTRLGRRWNRDPEDFKSYFPDDTFDFENKKLFVTVTDIIQGEVHYLESGSLIQALLASASFPGVFAPIKKGNLVLADGGIANNFPVEPLLNSCSKIIGVYVNPLKKIDSNKLKTAYAVMNRSFAISRNVQSVKKFSDCDIVICPTSLSRFSLFNLHHIDELFEIGYQATMDKKKDLLALF